VSEGLVLVGLSHHTAELELRERVAFPNGRITEALGLLRAVPGVMEGAIVSTCNRVEIITYGDDVDRVVSGIPGFIASVHAIDESALTDRLYVHRDRAAVRHVFRVASSLDSLVVGEPQILGQMKRQYSLAAAAGVAGPVLHRCFHRSFTVAKRIRTETHLAERAVSVGSAAAGLAREIFERLDDKTVLLVGAGALGELTARQLMAQGVGSLMVANRTFDRAVAIARELGGMPMPIDRIERHLSIVDLIVGCVEASEPVLNRGHVERALKDRRRRPMFLIDLAVPRCIDPGVHGLDDAYLYDIDDLEAVIDENREARGTDALRAEALIEGEVEAFWQWLRGRGAVPAIVALRDRAEAIRRRETDVYLAARPDASDAERATIERFSRQLVNKLLHEPTDTLRRRVEGGAGEDHVRIVRELFGLGPEDEDPE
jgi:glutamyl-tRNA reductase